MGVKCDSCLEIEAIIERYEAGGYPHDSNKPSSYQALQDIKDVAWRGKENKWKRIKRLIGILWRTLR